MTICVIIPAKPFELAKRRLAPVLAPAERRALACAMFLHVLSTAQCLSLPIVVVSRSREILRLAEENGAAGLKETGRSDLNAALEQAALHARARGAAKLLIVPGDLPLLGVADLQALAAEKYAIAPDRHRRGTNALLWPALSASRFHFGTNSFQRHCSSARATGFPLRVLSRPGFAYDVDMPADIPDMKKPTLNFRRDDETTRTAPAPALRALA